MRRSSFYGITIVTMNQIARFHLGDRSWMVQYWSGIGIAWPVLCLSDSSNFYSRVVPIPLHGIVVKMSMRRHADINRCFGKFVFVPKPPSPRRIVGEQKLPLVGKRPRAGHGLCSADSGADLSLHPRVTNPEVGHLSQRG